MKYDFIHDGDVLTFSGNWLISKIIQKWTSQPVSHVGMAVWLRFGEETEDKLCVLESMEMAGTRIVPLNVAMQGSSVTYWQKLDSMKVKSHEAVGWALQQWGGKYANWLQFLSFISPLYRKLREFVGMPAKIGEGFHCSGLVAQAMQFGGFTPPTDPAVTRPGDFWTWECLAKPEILQ